LLILSAIDLLSSALTAGVVLFVILVGADAGQSGDDSLKGKSGFNFVEVTDRTGALLLDKGVALPPTKSKPTGLETFFFGGNLDVVRRQYVVPADLKKISIVPSEGPFSFEFFVQPVVGSSFRLFIDCADSGKRLEILLRPLLAFPNCEKGSSVKNRSINVPAGSKLILPVATQLAGLPPPEFRSASIARYSLPNIFQLLGADRWGVQE
jgi:hypothetical protein